jgi:putative transposase
VVDHLPRPLSEGAGPGGEGGRAFGGRDGHAVRQDHGKGGARGFDAHKQVKGRKRAILVDTTGLLLSCRAEPAGKQDRTLAYGLLAGLKGIWPKVECVFADAGFESAALARWLKEHSGWRLEIVKRSQAGFVVQPKRWVVERTFAWLGRSRRLSKDYEQKVQSAEAWILVAMIRLVLRRLGEQT